MNAKKRRSRRPSAANSESLPKSPTFYLDRALGRHIIANALRAAGVAVEVHDDHLPIDAPDEDWIELIAQRGWVGITKDRHIRHRHNELAAVKSNNAKILVVRAKNATGIDIANILIKSLSAIQKFVVSNKPPFVAGVDRSRRVSKYEI